MATLTRTKTFSFKAPRELDDRIEHARAVLGELPEEQVLRELEMAVLRRPQLLTRTSNQSELLRTMVQLLVAATEKVERDRVNGDAYAAAAAERSEDESAFTIASTRAAAHRRQRDP